MKISEDQIDASIKAYAKKWMKSLDRPRTSTTLGYFFAGLFILFWSSSLTHEMGLDVKTLIGALVFTGTVFILISLMWLLIRIMAGFGINRSTRSALLLSAVIGPYIYMAVYQHWNSAVISHISGFVASICAFIFSIFLDKILSKKTNENGGNSI